MSTFNFYDDLLNFILLSLINYIRSFATSSRTWMPINLDRYHSLEQNKRAH